MRISGGDYRGRILNVPKGQDIRPASDKVRQAVFNALLSRIDLENTHIFDGFCGTGSYGLEALSRGAASCIFIDQKIKTCQENIRALDVADISTVIQKDVLKLPYKPDDLPTAGLFFLDPPYRKNLLLPALEHLREKGWLAMNALGVLECEKELWVNMGEEKIYGDVKITFVTL